MSPLARMATLSRGLAASRHQVARLHHRALGSLDLAGVYPPVVTPFNTDETIAWDKLKENLAMWSQQPLRCL